MAAPVIVHRLNFLYVMNFCLSLNVARVVYVFLLLLPRVAAAHCGNANVYY